MNGLFDSGEPADFTVTLMDHVVWTPSIDGVDFALTRVECNDTVDSEGETSRIGSDPSQFCCPSYRSRAEKRHQRLEDGV